MLIPQLVSEQITQAFRLYPNPSDENVFVASDADMQAVKLYDIAGRLVRHITICGTTTELDVKDLDGGIYFIQAIYSNGNTTTQKLVVTHWRKIIVHNNERTVILSCAFFVPYEK